MYFFQKIVDMPMESCGQILALNPFTRKFKIF